MFTYLITSLVLAGASLNASPETITKPTCCMKKAYCCSNQQDCCPKSATSDAATIEHVAAATPNARPTCCAKRASCCTIKEPCCGDRAPTAINDSAGMALTRNKELADDMLAKNSCCAKLASCCSAKRSGCSNSAVTSAA